MWSKRFDNGGVRKRFDSSNIEVRLFFHYPDTCAHLYVYIKEAFIMNKFRSLGAYYKIL